MQVLFSERGVPLPPLPHTHTHTHRRRKSKPHTLSLNSSWGMTESPECTWAWHDEAPITVE